MMAQRELFQAIHNNPNTINQQLSVSMMAQRELFQAIHNAVWYKCPLKVVSMMAQRELFQAIHNISELRDSLLLVSMMAQRELFQAIHNQVGNSIHLALGVYDGAKRTISSNSQLYFRVDSGGNRCL